MSTPGSIRDELQRIQYQQWLKLSGALPWLNATQLQPHAMTKYMHASPSLLTGKLHVDITTSASHAVRSVPQNPQQRIVTALRPFLRGSCPGKA